MPDEDKRRIEGVNVRFGRRLPCGGSGIFWIKGTDLREKVRGILGQTPDQMGNVQWIGHVLNRLQLTDNSRRRHHVGGKLYANTRREVLDMIQRYDVPPIENGMAK